MDRVYICIDLKSFYASVECVERGLNPLDTNLVVADEARTAKTMSLSFTLLIIGGYIAGITAKILSNQINFVLIAYLLNLAIVSMNVVVYFINRRYDKLA